MGKARGAAFPLLKIVPADGLIPSLEQFREPTRFRKATDLAGTNNRVGRAGNRIVELERQDLIEHHSSPYDRTVVRLVIVLDYEFASFEP